MQSAPGGPARAVGKDRHLARDPGAAQDRVVDTGQQTAVFGKAQRRPGAQRRAQRLADPLPDFGIAAGDDADHCGRAPTLPTAPRAT